MLLGITLTRDDVFPCSKSGSLPCSRHGMPYSLIVPSRRDRIVRSLVLDIPLDASV